MTRNTTATIYYIRKDSVYETEKPYSVDFESDSFASTNLRTHCVDGITITDLRGVADSYTFHTNGFEVLQFESSMTYDDWADQRIVESKYCEELGACLIKHFHASAVQIFEAQVRRRHSTFPDSNVDVHIREQPALQPHVDASYETTETTIRKLNGNDTNELLKKRWLYLNIWKPLRGPLRDWPLALCDTTSVIPDTDLIETDNVVGGKIQENLMMHFDERQRWFYLSDQMPDELLLFRQADSDGNTGVPHVSFRYNIPDGDEESLGPRESIEVRAILFF